MLKCHYPLLLTITLCEEIYLIVLLLTKNNMKNHSKELLRCEKQYFADKLPSQKDSNETVIKRLLEIKPKPDFKNFPQSKSIFALQIHSFIIII